MAELSDVVGSLYTRLVLRDVFGKIVPGALVLFAAYSAFVSHSAPNVSLLKLGDGPLGIWVILGALGWLGGFAVQALGEKWNLIRTYPKRIADCQFRRDLVEFAHIATPDERQTLERFVVIKEACGNAYVSVCLAVALAALGCVLSDPIRWDARWPGLAAVALAAALLLRWMHRRHVDRQQDWLDAVRHYYEEGPNWQRKGPGWQRAAEQGVEADEAR